MLLVALPEAMSLMYVSLDRHHIHFVIDSLIFCPNFTMFVCMHADTTAKRDAIMPHEKRGYRQWEISRSTYRRKGG